MDQQRKQNNDWAEKKPELLCQSRINYGWSEIETFCALTAERTGPISKQTEFIWTWRGGASERLFRVAMDSVDRFLKWKATSSSQVSWSGWNLILRFIILLSLNSVLFFLFHSTELPNWVVRFSKFISILLNIGNISFAVFKKDLLAFKLIMSYLNSVIASLSPLSRMWTQLRRMLQQFCLAQG